MSQNLLTWLFHKGVVVHNVSLPLCSSPAGGVGVKCHHPGAEGASRQVLVLFVGV